MPSYPYKLKLDIINDFNDGLTRDDIINDFNDGLTRDDILNK